MNREPADCSGGGGPSRRLLAPHNWRCSCSWRRGFADARLARPLALISRGPGRRDQAAITRSLPLRRLPVPLPPPPAAAAAPEI